MQEEKELELEQVEEINDLKKQESNNEEKPKAEEEGKTNVFDIFAWIGLFASIIALLASFVGFGLFAFWIGIILSCIGKKSVKHRKKADYGLLFSIFSLVMTISLFIFTA